MSFADLAPGFSGDDRIARRANDRSDREQLSR
jgi:hypothetical protein